MGERGEYQVYKGLDDASDAEEVEQCVINITTQAGYHLSDHGHHELFQLFLLVNLAYIGVGILFSCLILWTCKTVIFFLTHALDTHAFEPEHV